MALTEQARVRHIDTGVFGTVVALDDGLVMVMPDTFVTGDENTTGRAYWYPAAAWTDDTHAVGDHVEYRFWPTQEFITGTVAAIHAAGSHGDIYRGGTVEIKRDGYRETAVMPLSKFIDSDYVVSAGDDATGDDDQIKGDVCIDCLMVIANGDTSGIDDVAAWQLRVDANDPTDNGAYMVVPVGDETFFGCGACDYCGSTLAGDRHDVVFVDMRAGGSNV